MEQENHMIIGKEYPAGWDKPELTDDEISEIFKSWLNRMAKPDYVYFEMFLECWSVIELYTFMQCETLNQEFDKYKVDRLKIEFDDDTGITVSTEQVLKEI